MNKTDERDLHETMDRIEMIMMTLEVLIEDEIAARRREWDED